MNNKSNSTDEEISKIFNDPERVTKALQAGIMLLYCGIRKWVIQYVSHVMVKFFGFHQKKFL